MQIRSFTISPLQKCILLGLFISGCGGGGSSNSSATSTTTTSSDSSSATTTSSTTVATSSSSKTSSSTATSSSTSSVVIPTSVTKAAITQYPHHGLASDYTWNTSNETLITLYDTSAVVSGSGAAANKSTVTISSGGSFRIKGNLYDGQIVVDTSSNDPVRLILDNASITNTTTSPVFVKNAEKVVVVLAADSKNTLTDSANYVFATGEDEPNATLFSKSDLSITGTGKLTIDANYADGIVSKDGLIINNGTLVVDAIDDGVRGKDYLIVEAGNLTVTTAGDALKSNDEEVDKGIVWIQGGTITATSTSGDAISAESALQITGGTFNLKTGSNGSSTSLTSTSNSMKALKATTALNVFAGSFTIDSAEDAIHSNNSIQINGGNFSIKAGDDGAHADTSLAIFDGAIDVTKAYEGIESAAIFMNGGSVKVTTSDDGVNVAGGTNESTAMPGTRPGDSFSSGSNYKLYINGGYLYVNSSGDGLDANGSIEMTGGTVVVSGPTANDNAPLDYDGTFLISGGTLLAAGSSGMAQAPSTTSTQNSVKITFTSIQTAGKITRIQTSDGKEISTYAPAKNYTSFVYSSPLLTTSNSFDIFQGGTYSTNAVDGVFSGGTYSDGTKATSFTVSSRVTSVSK